jgi:purine nucleosidase
MDVLIDADPGIDDAIALLLALRSPDVDVRGISVVHGNVPVEAGTANAVKVLDLAGRLDVPVARGAAAPLLRDPRHAEIVHGRDGLAELIPAPEEISLHEDYGPGFLVHALEDAATPVTLVALGPLTNVAIALLSAPGAAEWIERLVVMGGAIRVEGNVTPSAEFNIFADPEAAAIVLRAGVPVALVPLDVTMKAVVRGDVGRRLAEAADPVERFLGQLISHVSGIYGRYYRIDGMAMHDPLAMAVALEPSLVTTEHLHVDVETGSGLAAGRTIADFWHIPEPWGEPNADVALELDAERFDELLWTRLLGRYPP